jgi:hypothetical protein
MVRGGVRPGVPRPQHDGQRLPGRAGAMVGEYRQRMMAERFLPGGGRLFLLGVRDHDRGIDIDRDQPAARTRGLLPGQRPRPFPRGRARRPDRRQSPRRVPGQLADQAGDHRVRRHRPEQLRLAPQHGHIGQAVPAQRQRDRQVRDDLAGVVHRPRRPPPDQPRRQLPAQARDLQDLGEQQRPGLGDNPRSVSGHDDLGTARGILHGKSAFGWVRTGPSTSPMLPVQRHFFTYAPAPRLPQAKARG